MTGLGNDVATNVHDDSGDPPSRSECWQVSQPIDKPVDEVPGPANVQHPVGDHGRQTNKLLQGTHLIQFKVTSPDEPCAQVHEQMLLGDLDAPSNEPTPLLHGSASSVSVSGPSSTTPLYAFNSDNSNSLLMGPFGDQYGDQGFGNSTGIDWSTLQGPDSFQVQGNVPSDLWFDSINSIPGSLSAIQSAPTGNSSSILLGPFPNSNTQELYFPGVYSSLLLPQQVVPIGNVNPPPSTLLTEAIDPHILPPLAPFLAQGCPPHALSPSIQLPTDLSLGSPGGKGNEAVAVGRRGPNKRGGGRKRKVDDALVGTKDSGAPKPGKKHAKYTRETVEEGATEATTEEDAADRLEKEAKAAQDVATKAAKAANDAKVAVKAAKEAKDVAKPEQTRRSACVHARLT